VLNDRATEIAANLKKAAETSFSPWKFDYLYKAAKLQCASKLYDDAKKTYELLKNTESWGSFSVEKLLKIAKIAIMINPTETPKELKDAKDQIMKNCEWQTTQPFGRNTLGTLYAGDLTLLAKRYFQLNKKDDGNVYLQQAKQWAGYGGGDFYREMSVGLKIAKVYKNSNQPEKCLEFVKTIVKYMSKISLGRMKTDENSLKASYKLDCAELILSIDKDYGNTLIASAREVLEKIDEPDEYEQEYKIRLDKLVKVNSLNG